ncbi:hypothetical protein OAS39_03755, partial [Pirellulales bacterium]|nr:hypothetical protein [Pirellulales bacterium]
MNDRARNYLDDLVEEVDEVLRHSQLTNHDEVSSQRNARAKRSCGEQGRAAAREPIESENSASNSRERKRASKDQLPADPVLQLPT